MRTVEEVLAELRELAAKAAAGQNVTKRRQEVEAELAEHGIRIGQKQQEEQRAPSRYVGPNADSDLARRLSAGEQGDRRIAHPGPGGSTPGSAVNVLLDVRAAKAGEPAANARLAAASKGMEGGAYLVKPDVIPGYVEVVAANTPIRGLATVHDDINGREVWMVVEGDDDLVTEHVPEGGAKPYSEADVLQKVSVIHKAAGVTSLPDELIEDSGGQANEIIADKFGRSIGKTLDVALLDGTGVGQPLGLLRHTGITHTPVAGQTAMEIYVSIVRAVYRVSIRFPGKALSVVLHPQVLERFDLALDANDNFQFSEGLAGKLQDKARVVEDANLPVAVDGAVPIVVGAFKYLHYFARKGLVVEESQAVGFTDDETFFRAVERYGVAVSRPSAFEVVDGADLTLA